MYMYIGISQSVYHLLICLHQLSSKHRKGFKFMSFQPIKYSNGHTGKRQNSDIYGKSEIMKLN